MYIFREEHFGTIERIQELMQDKGYTQERLALETDINVRSIRRWKTGTKIRKSNLERIAFALNCDVEYLECTQNYPRKENQKIKLSVPSFTDRYLYKIQTLLESTNKHFIVRPVFDPVRYKVITDTFIDGETRYYYETTEAEEYRPLTYSISINGGEYFIKSKEEMDDFVKGIMKFISYQVDLLNT